MKNLGIKGDWREGKAKVTVNLPVMIFSEENVLIAYVPVLDLSGYGATENEAVESLKIVLSEYFSYGMKKKTLIQDLKAHGWTVKKKTKPYIAPEITDLINKNDYLHDIVNSRPYKMERIDVEMPQYSS